MNSLDIFKNKGVLQKSLQTTCSFYRPLDPGWYLYNKIIKYTQDDKFSDDFIELVYVCLSAWNMNSRGAKLNNFRDFKKSIIDCKPKLTSLERFQLADMHRDEVRNVLYQLFLELRLVETGKPPLITFSKTLHFYFPNLIGPIDRTYTLSFFYGHHNLPKQLDCQFNKFMAIQLEFARFSKTVELLKYQDSVWNTTIPKIIDNAIIGYLLLSNN